MMRASTGNWNLWVNSAVVKGFNDLILGHRYKLFVFVLCIQFVYISMTTENTYIKLQSQRWLCSRWQLLAHMSSFGCLGNPVKAGHVSAVVSCPGAHSHCTPPRWEKSGPFRIAAGYFSLRHLKSSNIRANPSSVDAASKAPALLPWLRHQRILTTVTENI